MIQPGQLITRSLAKFPRSDDICHILAAAINSADPGNALRNVVSLQGHHLIVDRQPYNLQAYHRLLVIAFGKASIPMATTLLDILGNLVTKAVAIAKKGYSGLTQTYGAIPLRIFEASHPIPDQSNLAASVYVRSLIGDITQDDLVICLISGGGSALLVQPSPQISLTDIQLTTKQLLACGADIGAINTIRKHLDEYKGGGLARLLYPATVISLIISDVVGDHLDQIASGPTVADPTTYQEALSILNKYQISFKIPSTVLTHIQNGVAGKIKETVKPGDPTLENVHNGIIGSNSQALYIAQQTAIDLGFNTQLLTTTMQGEASQVGASLALQARTMHDSFSHNPPPVCFLAGGETTVTLHGTGIGGRNQELALGAVLGLSGERQVVLVSLASDGEDGPTDAAGAVVTHETHRLGLSMGLDPTDFLANHDSYHYFTLLEDLVKTGPTLTNVNDFVLIVAL